MCGQSRYDLLRHSQWVCSKLPSPQRVPVFAQQIPMDARLVRRGPRMFEQGEPVVGRWLKNDEPL